MKRLFTAPFAGLLAMAAGSAMPGAAAEQKAAAKAGDGPNCLSNSQITNRIAEDGQTIRFELLGGRVYRSRLSGRCPGLQQAANGFGTLAFDLHGDQLCRGDLLRVVDASRGGTMTLRTAPACPLGPFERVEDRAARPRDQTLIHAGGIVPWRRPGPSSAPALAGPRPSPGN
jgi:hypothetical protein